MIKKTNFKIWLVASILWLLSFPAYAGQVIYVKADAPAGGGGGSWETAYNILQDGLDDAESGDEIWLVAGTYYPTSDYGLGIGVRGNHFRMKNEVGIYGGFDGTETTLAQRDVQNNVTILSGDLLGNDDPYTPVEYLIDDPCRADNCYHVFYHPEGTDLDPNAIIDGVTITAGNAGEYPHDYGSGMYNYSSSPTVTGCTFSGNSAVWEGGGMYNDNGDPQLTNCTFIGNLAFLGGGMFNGSMWSMRICDPKLTNCTFSGNSAEGSGGGMLNGGIVIRNPILINCTFSGNSAAFSGGGMANRFSSHPILTNCIIWGGEKR